MQKSKDVIVSCLHVTNFDESTDLASRGRAPGGAADHWRSYSPCLHKTWNKTKEREGINFYKWKTANFAEMYLLKPVSTTQHVYCIYYTKSE